MKKIILAIVFSLVASNAYADVYVKVDANGVAIGGPIMCDGLQCGNPESTYSKLTLQPGERYVLQGTGQAGIGNNNPNTEVKVDLQTNVWTVTNTETQKVVQQFTPQTNPSNPQPAPKPEPVVTPQPSVDSVTVTVDTKTATVDTKTVIVDTPTVITTNQIAPTIKSVITKLNNLKKRVMELLGL